MKKPNCSSPVSDNGGGLSRRQALRRAAGAGALVSLSSLAAGLGVPVAADANGNKRLAYIGQGLFLSGKALGQRIVELVPEGEVVGFIATPGQLNIQPRLDGAREAIKESGKNIKLNEVASGPTLNEEASRMVLISGEVDLSAGQVYALSPFVMYHAHRAGVPFVPAIALALVPAAAIGMVNGLVTVVLEIPSFITTLGTLFLINGLTLTISGGFPVAPKADPIVTNVFGGNAVAQILWAMGVALVFQFVLVKTRWGLHTIATGGNLVGAAEVGIKVGWIKIGNLIICSVLGGLAGILDAFRIGSIDPLAGGTEIMFMAIASSVIGGTLLTAGSGTIIGAFFGAAVLGILKDGFTLSGVSAYTFDMILGGAILVTMLINVRLSRLRAAGGGR